MKGSLAVKAEVRMHDLFDNSYDRLEGSVKQRVVDFIMKIQREPEAPGLDYKIPKLAQNNRVRTARVTEHYRAVLVVAGEDDGTSILYLVAVKKHDAAYDYASKLTLQINAKTGAAELFDAIALEEAVAKHATRRRWNPPRSRSCPRRLSRRISNGSVSIPLSPSS